MKRQNRNDTRQWHPTPLDAVEGRDAARERDNRAARAYYAEYRHDANCTAIIVAAFVAVAAVTLALAIRSHGEKVERMAAATERLAPVADVAARVEAACAKAEEGASNEQ